MVTEKLWIGNKLTSGTHLHIFNKNVHQRLLNSLISFLRAFIESRNNSFLSSSESFISISVLSVAELEQLILNNIFIILVSLFNQTSIYEVVLGRVELA